MNVEFWIKWMKDLKMKNEESKKVILKKQKISWREVIEGNERQKQLDINKYI